MMPRSFPEIAVIADAHFHDVDADFGFSGVRIGGRAMTMRSWSDTRQSTRVFNESAGALLSALGHVQKRGIRHVVLLGDYSDDGQRATTEKLADILQQHSREHGTAFYALPGNHDIFGPRGRHHTKQFLTEGGQAILVSSDAGLAREGAVFSDRMYCEGYPDGLRAMANFGYFRRPEYIHWESPFGLSDAQEDRVYEVTSPDGVNRYRLMDASYLVEPEPGLWLLMIDANVFEPLDGAFADGEEAAFTDSTAGGWNAMLRAKPFIFSWVSDVTRRARLLDKTVLAFSHYPALDPFDGASDAEKTLFGETNVVRRTPRREVEEAILSAGLQVHFSGHLHVEGVTTRGYDSSHVTNIAVPSLVAFPPAFKVIRPTRHHLAVDTVGLSAIAVDRDLLSGYRLETNGRHERGADALSADSYGAFLQAHKRALVVHRYLPKEWPGAFAAAILEMNVAQAAQCVAGGAAGESDCLELSSSAQAEDLPMIDLIADWYCLRQGGHLSIEHIEPERLALYRSLTNQFGRAPDAYDGSLPSFLGVFLGALGLFLDRAAKGRPNIVVPLERVQQDVPA
ncbi:metallophosphoesterase family protein [Rhizobium leguminosarum]|uniref:metallophosphoesterase family protein n=1 Tax=Rhizobium leguminosarum TaxID=384 RepID=UPI001C97F8E4|nr:metallophosphoesterase [Rhizobium leguminosarum]MBY5466427.1 metallophosphoesterase [Rhizobium leguminosarum]